MTFSELGLSADGRDGCGLLAASSKVGCEILFFFSWRCQYAMLICRWLSWSNFVLETRSFVAVVMNPRDISVICFFFRCWF